MKSALSLTRRAAPALSGSSSAQRYAIPMQRHYSSQVPSRSDGLPAVDFSKLSITKTSSPKQITSPEKLVFGSSFTGKCTVVAAHHMLMMNWNTKDGWLAPNIVPYQKLSLDPSTCVFHYAFECFEGMKAYKDKNGGIRLFRPDKNMERLNKSSKRIALPTFDGEAVTKLIGELVKVDSRFIPEARGYSLYIRPTMIGTQATLGVNPPNSAMLFVIACPVGPYYPTGFKAISLEATDYAVRAWPGGVGDKKLGANYAPCILPQLEAAKKGFQQNLWLFGEEEYVTEVGTMNLFVAIKDKKTGQNELITAPLDGTILEGVTRDSVLTLARERLGPRGWVVSERKLKMSEIAQASEEGRLIEIFGAGTAAIVSPVRTISWKGRLVDCGLKENEEAGQVALEMKNWIEGIQYGDEEHIWR
ncbi:branched-chain amino acid aminotransferase [Helicocarpus griseus UAMH5409]|uniref:Branched-chain-amino-acid aminotransferase n=1 Tax=Helicocarpus griseus UAMH5409 TaxID=1447875 RepID=A0A2B7XHZ3_9EURO|nr:branched-chain amino acid aminotransferase [Helicocarpus griseus UAMH5409]